MLKTNVDDITLAVKEERQKSLYDGTKEGGQSVGRVLHSSDFIKNVIPEQAISGIVIQTGTAAKRPDGSSHTKAYFATDTLAFSIWTGSAWKSTTLA